MDFLTHLFLPIAVVYVLRTEVFDTPLAFALAGFAILPDVEKVIGLPVPLHSAVTLLPIAGAVVLIDRRYVGATRYAPIAVALLYSHLVLDIIDGNLVPVLAPLTDWGIGLRYPGHVVLGGKWPIMVQGDLIALVVQVPPPGTGGPGTYPLVQKYGVISALVFIFIVLPTYGQGADL